MMDTNNEFQHQAYLILRDWIDINKLDWVMLSKNYNAVALLENNLDMVNWRQASSNKNFVHILKDNLDKVNWSVLNLYT